MKGFTLLELMVVVIIISILTAAALPQYQKAVEKSRAAEAITLGKTIVDAQNRSLDAFPNESVATKSALDVKLPGGEDAWSSDDVYTTKDFKYTLQSEGVLIERKVGGPVTYTLFMGNNEATAENSCTNKTGTLCNAMTGMGFKVQTAEEE